MKALAWFLVSLSALIGCSKREEPVQNIVGLTEAQIIAESEKRGPGWVYEKTVDENGKVIEEGWKFHPVPDLYKTNGLSHLKPYIAKLCASKNWSSSVNAFTPDGERGTSLTKTEGQYDIFLSFRQPIERDRESKARSFFASRGMETQDDYLADDGETRILSWIVKGDVDELTKLLKLIAIILCNIKESEALEIQFEEHPDERGKFKDAQSTRTYLFYRESSPTDDKSKSK